LVVVNDVPTNLAPFVTVLTGAILSGGFKMKNQTATRVSIYINEGDEWRHRPLHLEVLRMLHAKGMAGGTVLRAVAGFTGGGGVAIASPAGASGKLPLVIEFIDTLENVERVMPQLKKMAGQRLIVREPVEVEGNPLGS
jgi:PII-like signaling protein